MSTFTKTILTGTVATFIALAGTAANAQPLTHGKLTADDVHTWAGQPADFYNNLPAEQKQPEISDARKHAQELLSQSEEAFPVDKSLAVNVDHSEDFVVAQQGKDIQAYQIH